MPFQIPLADTNSYDLELPTFTLDVNQIPLQPPAVAIPELHGLLNLEYNYFGPHSVDLCVTPTTPEEITRGQPSTSLGAVANNRFLKSELYKRRPPDAILHLADDDAGELWSDMRSVLWPTVTGLQLTPNQRADVDQIFWHAVSSGSMSVNSAFLTLDNNFLRNAQYFKNQYGVLILDPNSAWESFRGTYGLQLPTPDDLHDLWAQQHGYFARIGEESS